MKKLFTFLALVCCVATGAWAEDFGFASSAPGSDNKVAAVVVTTHTGDGAPTVAVAHGAKSQTGTGKGTMYWGSTTALTFNGTCERSQYKPDGGTNAYFAEFKNDAWVGATITIPKGYKITATQLYYEIAGQDYKWHYKASIINGDGTAVLTQSDQAGASGKTPKASSKLTVTQALDNVELTGTVTIKIFWYGDVTNSSKYMAVPVLKLTGTIGTAAAQTKYSMPTITQGTYDQPTGKYAVTISTAEGETGTISYKIGDGAYQTYSEAIAVAPSTKVTAKVSGSSYSESDEKEYTTSAAPKLAAPKATVDSYNFINNKYSITISAATGATIQYSTDNWTTTSDYSSAINVEAGTTIKAKAVQTNMTTSDELVIAVPATPTDGTHTTPNDGSQSYKDGTSYNAGAYTIAADPTYLGGSISSGNSSINGCIKMRLSRAADPTDFADKYGFHLDVNPGYTITSVKLQILNNYDTDIAATGIYVDDATTTNLLASPITIPYASANTVAAAEVKADNISATKRIVFTFDKNSGTNNPNQAQVLITVSYIVPEVVKVSEVGYATYAPKHNVTIPEGVEVYTVQSNPSATAVTLAKFNGETIKSGEGVIIKAESANYVFAPAASAETISGNQLVGVTEDTALEEGKAYILAKQGGKAVFSKCSAGTLAAGKAYLPTTSGAQTLQIVFDDEATAVEKVTTQNSEHKTQNLYNLAGQKVSADYKGIVIKNGKRVVVK